MRAPELITYGNGNGHAARRTVLIVDDDVAIRMLVADALEPELNVKVVPLSDGYEAIQWLSRGRADLVLLDLVMPVVDGLAVLRWVGQHPSDYRMPIVAFTAAGLPAVKELMDRGAHDAITKPFDVDHLVSTVRDQLDGRVKRGKRVRSLALRG